MPRRARTGLIGLGLVLCLALLFAGQFSGSAFAAEKAPKLNAKAWVMIDARTGEVLAGSKANQHLPMASTTKMMTAYLALKKLPMGEMVPAADYKAAPVESIMGLEAGQVISVRDLLYGLIMLSGNDAAVTLAEAVSGSEKRFVKLMNATARRLGLNDTSYENSVGLDGKRHYTSARDLARLGQILMEMPRFRPIASARSAKLKSYSPPLEIETLNDFVLNNPWAKGIKTGHTETAGYVLVSDGRRKAADLIGAVIGAPTEAERDSESVRLLDYGFSLYKKEVPIRPGKVIDRVPVKYEDEELELGTAKSVRIGVREDENLVVTPNLPDEVEGPITRGDKIGTATVTVDGEKIATVGLLASSDIAEPTLIDKLMEGAFFKVVALLIVVLVILGSLAIMRHRHESRTRSRLRRVTRNRR